MGAYRDELQKMVAIPNWLDRNHCSCVGSHALRIRHGKLNRQYRLGGDRRGRKGHRVRGTSDEIYWSGVGVELLPLEGNDRHSGIVRSLMATRARQHDVGTGAHLGLQNTVAVHREWLRHGRYDRRGRRLWQVINVARTVTC